MSGCATSSTPPCEAVQPHLPPQGPSPLVVAHCPEALPMLKGDTMGDLVEALMDAAESYHKCRTAAMAR